MSSIPYDQATVDQQFWSVVRAEAHEFAVYMVTRCLFFTEEHPSYVDSWLSRLWRQ